MAVTVPDPLACRQRIAVPKKATAAGIILAYQSTKFQFVCHGVQKDCLGGTLGQHGQRRSRRGDCGSGGAARGGTAGSLRRWGGGSAGRQGTCGHAGAKGHDKSVEFATLAVVECAV